jgi:hypothetical protein
MFFSLAIPGITLSPKTKFVEPGEGKCKSYASAYVALESRV